MTPGCEFKNTNIQTFMTIGYLHVAYATSVNRSSNSSVGDFDRIQAIF